MLLQCNSGQPEPHWLKLGRIGLVLAALLRVANPHRRHPPRDGRNLAFRLGSLSPRAARDTMPPLRSRFTGMRTGVRVVHRRGAGSVLCSDGLATRAVNWLFIFDMGVEIMNFQLG